MGRIRVAKDGHRYERRRTYGGRYYTVQHSDSNSMGGLMLALVLGLLFLALVVASVVCWPATLVILALLWAVAAIAPNL
jgi:hypothetical protein